MNWTTISKYVDIETGEQLTKETYIKLYYTVKRDRETKIKGDKYGEIIYTNIGRRRPIQGRIY